MIEKPEFKDQILEVEDVASAIVNQVISGRGGQLILPKEVNFVSTIRALPSWFQTTVRNNIAMMLEVSDEELDVHRP